MSLGHALAAYECALTYCSRRNQFGEPLVHRQLVQEHLATMLADVTGMQLHCFRLARLAEQGALGEAQASLAKLWNARAARRVVAEARDLLGGNGILLDHHVMRHMADLESLYTFEGTDSMQALLVGRDVTGVSAFR
jgi:glutaryl-CoA dehydrogenase